MAQHRYVQELRLSSPLYNIPRIFLDIKILGRTFAAVLNTFSRRTWVDFAIKVFISRRDPESIRNHISPYPEETIPVPIEFHMVHSIHSAIVRPMDDDDDEVLIHIGMDFLMDRGISMNLGGITLDTRQSWVTTHPDDIEFVYNHPRGRLLRQALEDNENNFDFKPNFRRMTIDRNDFIDAEPVNEMNRDAGRFGD